MKNYKVYMSIMQEVLFLWTLTITTTWIKKIIWLKQLKRNSNPYVWLSFVF